MNVETMKRLKAALAERESVDIGNFQLINLDMVRAEAGDRWEDLSKKIYTAAGHFIEKRLGGEDVMVRCKGGFILIYARLTGAEAARQTEAISLDLNRFFLGDRILEKLQISAKTNSVSMAELADMVSGSQEEPPAEKAPPKRQRKRKTRDKSRKDGVGQWRALDHETSGKAGGYAEDAQGRSQAPLPSATDVEKAEAGSPVAPAEQGDFAGMAERMMVGSHDMFSDLDKVWDDIIFMPAWDARTGYIMGSFCQARRQYNGRTLYGRKTLLGKNAPDLHRLLDHSVAIAAQRGFMRRYVEGVKCAIVIPVNYDTIVNVSDRVRYFSILQSVPQRVRRYFFLRVDNIPDGAPMGQMEELFRAVRCFGSSILAKIPVGTIQFGRFENCGVSMFASELPDPDADGGIRESVLNKLASQAISTQRAGARCGLTRVATHKQLTAAMAAGFEVFTGDAISPPQDRPVPLEPYLLDDLRRSIDAA